MEKQSKKFKIGIVFCGLLCLALIGLCLCQALWIYLPQKQEQKQFEQLRQLVLQTQEENDDGTSPYAFLKEKNEDFAGWLTIPDTIIDYPVMKSSERNPEKYLYRDFDTNDSYSGTPFVGLDCTDQSDRFVIYGHHMHLGTLFGKLDDYRDETFAKEHSVIYYETLTERREYRVFAALHTKIGDEAYYPYYEKMGDGMEIQAEFVNQIVKDACVVLDKTPPTDKQIVLLSTSSYYTGNDRFFVAAYREK